MTDEHARRVTHSPTVFWLVFFGLFALGLIAAVYFTTTGQDLGLLAVLIGVPLLLTFYTFRTANRNAGDTNVE